MTDTATAHLDDQPISTKAAVEIANTLRGKSTEEAKHLLNDVINKERAIPYEKFQHGAGHRSGQMGSGKYPVKASKAFLTAVKSAEHNAKDIGLAPDLRITDLRANKGTTRQSYGRQRGRQQKRTHIDIEVTEQEA